MKTAMKILNGAITAALILVIATAGFLAFSARRSGDAIPTMFGHKVLTVISGSMEPAIGTGDVIVVKPVTNPTQEVRDGDVITYRAREKTDMLITHRVKGTILVNGEPIGYMTQGDANEAPDTAPIAPEQIIGIYQWRVPYFGYVTTFLRQPLGIVLFVILPGVMLIGLEFRKIWVAMIEDEKAKAAATAAQGGGEEQQ